MLADEPTGALDSDTSVQIMDLIKEIAGERLVIMVTHNPELAQQYSTRIVRLTDGVVVDDSDPFVEDETGEEIAAPLAEQPKVKGKKQKKTSMSFLTAFGLSGRNLLTKKGRTLITSIAGSIGIIGVCLVLALSSGFGGYITRTEEDMLSAYPIQVTETTMDYETIMNNMMNGMMKPDLDRMDDKVYVNSFLTKLSEGMTVKNNITREYLDYIAAMDPSLYGAIQYGYGMSLNENLYTEVEINPGVLTPDTSDDKGQSKNWVGQGDLRLLQHVAQFRRGRRIFFDGVAPVLAGFHIQQDARHGRSYVRRLRTVRALPVRGHRGKNARERG